MGIFFPLPSNYFFRRIKLLRASLNSSSTQGASHLVLVKKQYLYNVSFTPQAKGMDHSNDILIKVYEENLDSHYYLDSLKGSINILTAFSKKIVDILLWYHSKIWQVVVSQRLVAMWNLQSYQWTFCTLLHLVLRMDHLSMCILTLWIGHLGNIGSLSYSDIPIIDTFYYPISKNGIC